jgi:hypothetical protein
MRLRFLLPLLFSACAWGAVAFNNTNTPANVTGTSYSHAFSVTAGGSNIAAFACINPLGTPSLTITSITYGGSSMTSVGAAQGAGTGGASVLQCFVLVNPPTGSNTLAFTCSVGCVSATANLVSYTGVNQSTPVRSGTYASTNCSSSCSTISLTITSNTADLTMSAVSGGNGIPNISSTNQTSDGILNSASEGFGSDHATTPASSVTHTWTMSSGSGVPPMVGFSIQAASAVSGHCAACDLSELIPLPLLEGD